MQKLQHQKTMEILRKVLLKKGFSVDAGRTIFKKDFPQDMDFIVTMDLMGFERTTESGSYTYNLQTFRMLHLLFGDRREYEDILRGKLSIAMFFCCIGEEEKIREKYSQIPFLYGTPDNTEESMDRAIDVFLEQAAICKHGS